MICNVEGDWFRYPMQAQVSCYLVVLIADMFDMRTLEDNCGIFLYGKEARRTQVGITQHIVGIDTGCINFSLDPGAGGILLINRELATKHIEASFRCADPKDSDSKRHM